VRRWATRPFVGVVVDAGRAAAKSYNLQGSQKSQIVGDQTGQWNNTWNSSQKVHPAAILGALLPTTI